jgi:hypothetical protein
METKEQLVQHIKGWMSNDNEIREIQARLKELKDKRKGYADNLVEIMRKNEIDCFDVNDGKLIYTKTKVKAPLNKTTLATSLMKYFKDDYEQAKELVQFLLESREEKVKESIRRKVQK